MRLITHTRLQMKKEIMPDVRRIMKRMRYEELPSLRALDRAALSRYLQKRSKAALNELFLREEVVKHVI